MPTERPYLDNDEIVDLLAASRRRIRRKDGTFEDIVSHDDADYIANSHRLANYQIKALCEEIDSMQAQLDRYRNDTVALRLELMKYRMAPKGTETTFQNEILKVITERFTDLLARLDAEINSPEAMPMVTVQVIVPLETGVLVRSVVMHRPD